jgi:hypothetical protein
MLRFLTTLSLFLVFACAEKDTAEDEQTTVTDVEEDTDVDETDTSDEDTDVDPCTSGPSPTVRLGLGELEYEALDAGGENLAELIHGPQGGFHITMALAATQMDPSYPWAVDLEGRIDGELIGATRPLAMMRCNYGLEELQTWGLLLIWDAQPEDLHDRIAEITATTVDSAGTSVSGTGTVHIWDPSLE